ncbi:MAG TPA: 4a-hydroxytetrahydrobiopterin dehydratase [Thermoanaerobaculia bacterium]|nr:4a-hydroxytetrahydrobiopterin dehydratase [Thermoanaerobaculia bacterium]
MTNPLTSSTEDPAPPTWPTSTETLKLSSLKAERIQLALEQLPGWALAAEERAIFRSYELPTREAAVALLCLIVELSRPQRREPKLDLSGRHLTVTLSSPESRGVTEADLDLARQIALAP